MNLYKCVIVEDEPLAKRIIERHILQKPAFRVIATFSNAIEARQFIAETDIDLLFLDINLPVQSGIAFARSMQDLPPIIFTTAYAEYAATSYDLSAVDYLLKPITYERFTRAIEKFLSMRKVKSPASDTDYLFIKENGMLVKIHFNKILFVEARKDYLLISTPHRKHLTHLTMKAIESKLPSDQFFRIHRSYIVSKHAVVRSSTTFLEIHGRTLPVGIKYRQMLKDMLT